MTRIDCPLTGVSQMTSLALDTFDRNHAPASPCYPDSQEWNEFLSARDHVAQGFGYNDEADLCDTTEEDWVYELAAAYHRWSYPSLATREVKARQKRDSLDLVAARIEEGTYPPNYIAAESWQAEGWDAEIIAWAIDTYRQARPEFGPGSDDFDAQVNELIATRFAPSRSA
mgnify:CR=1 FL=1